MNETKTQVTQERVTLQDRLAKYMKISNMSMRRVATDMGISDAALVNWKRNKYIGNNERVDTLVKNYLDEKEEALSTDVTKIPICAIANIAEFRETAHLCHFRKEMGLVIGNAGLGKTTASKQYVNEYPNTILIECDSLYNTKAVLKGIARAINISPSMQNRELFDNICEKLKGSDRLLILDEAEHLTAKTLDIVRRIWDHTGIGVLLVGLPRLRLTITGSRFDHAYLYSRIGIMRELRPLNIEDCEKIVRQVFPRTSHEVIKTFLMKSGANIRMLEKLLLRTLDALRSNKIETLESYIVEDVSEYLAK